MIEKVALALITSVQRLRSYFQIHSVVVNTNYPIKQVLQKPKLAGRMVACFVELSQFDLQYKPRQFMAEFSKNGQTTPD